MKKNLQDRSPSRLSGIQKNLQKAAQHRLGSGKSADIKHNTWSGEAPSHTNPLKRPGDAPPPGNSVGTGKKRLGRIGNK